MAFKRWTVGDGRFVTDYCWGLYEGEKLLLREPDRELIQKIADDHNRLGKDIVPTLKWIAKEAAKAKPSIEGIRNHATCALQIAGVKVKT